jgi:hypothetical protein
MGVESALINEKISSELGEEGLRGLLACLWPVDCQTCGGFLGDEPPSLCVDDSVIFAVASLHHPGCRAPVWNDSGVITAVSDVDSLSYVTTALLLPLGRNGREEWWPMMVVNPGLESVVLEREDQSWRVRPNLAFKGAGLVPPGPGLMIGRPVDGAVALLTATSVAVAFQVTPLRTYEAPVDEAVAECARTRGGVLIGVTHALNPGELTEEDLNTAMATGQILMGWVGVHGAAPASKRSSPPLGATCVLHWNESHISVGTLLGKTPKLLSSKKARAWAARLIGAKNGMLLPWELADKDRSADGWFTMDALSANQYFLRRHPGGWTLVQAYSQASGMSVESDNEAKAWAAGVLRHRTGVSGVTWEPGPTTPGSSTLYARV